MNSSNSLSTDAPYLQPPPGRRYVRSFLFSRRISAPFAKVHLIPRTLLVLCMSGVQLRAINATPPDIISASILWIVSLALFYCSGMQAKTARIYLLLTFPALFSLFTTWIFFNPVPGRAILWRYPLYSGTLVLGLAVWQLLWLAIVVGYFLWTRKLVTGIFIATVVAIAQTLLLPLPAWTFARVAFFHPLTILVSDYGLLVAITKVIGYSGMVFTTIALVVTSRDAELIGTLRQLRAPHVIIFFLSTVFRALNLALTDYETIHQAQIARAINARPRSFIRRLRDLSSIAVPMVAMMIRRSSEIGDALIARGYRLGQASADFYETAPFRLIDWIVLACCLGLLYLAVGPYSNMTVVLHLWQ
ncbi:MAG TPA: energy-coupling factor transporter transmembrane component T [Ktedonobacteraceae bacterium]|nr:energy-coupling factor transporter transmembrane component T [Ktedonobacteraceae bacterium]